MIKKITTKKHTYLIEEVSSTGNEDAFYGHSLLLSIYIAINVENRTKVGQYYFSKNYHRIALRSSVLSITEPTDKELEFYKLVKQKESVNYSKKLVTQFGIKNYLRSFFVNSKEVQNNYPKCTLYYDSSIL